MGLKVGFVLLILLLVAGCAMTQAKPAPVGEPGTQPSGGRDGSALLQLGLRHYEEGQYKRAAATLQHALEHKLSPANRVLAHKHLAFIFCTSNRISKCRNEFSKAIDVDPRFDLAPAEIGHPQWGPVFRDVKARAMANS